MYYALKRLGVLWLEEFISLAIFFTKFYFSYHQKFSELLQAQHACFLFVEHVPERQCGEFVREEFVALATFVRGDNLQLIHAHNFLKSKFRRRVRPQISLIRVHDLRHISRVQVKLDSEHFRVFLKKNKLVTFSQLAKVAIRRHEHSQKLECFFVESNIFREVPARKIMWLLPKLTAWNSKILFECNLYDFLPFILSKRSRIFAMSWSCILKFSGE